MGFLDKLRSTVGLGSSKPAAAASAPPAQASMRPAASIPFLAPSKPPAGPLRLAAGDHVSHYRERFEVTGIRVLEGSGTTALHYCLRDANGAAAVIACEGGNAPSLSLQRAIKTDAKWDADVISGVADDPMKLTKSARMKVRTWGNCGVAATVKSVVCRAYADPSGEQVLCLEDYEGTRESRLGDPVFESELECERAGNPGGGRRTAALAVASKFEEVAPDAIVRGSPRAAAKALEENMKSKKPVADAPDRDPTAYDDDEWADAGEDEGEIAAPLPQKVAIAAKRSATLEDEDEWVSATQLVREHGEAGLDEDEIDAKRRAAK